MNLNHTAQRLLGRDRILRLAHLAYRSGIILAAPMHSLERRRNESVLVGEYIRASSLELVAHEINELEVPGVVAELGVFRGEFARLINAAFPKRSFYLFDTFTGFSESDVQEDAQRGYSVANPGDFSNTSISFVMSRMKFKDKCVIKQGFFPGSAQDCLEERFAFVSIDADLYEPIYEGLRFFYPRLSSRGYIFVHDYNNHYYKGAKHAIRQFCGEQGVPYFPLSDASGSVVISKA